MKATKAELIRLARLAHKDIGRGRIAKDAQQAAEILGRYQNCAIELLDLTLVEAAKGQSSQSLVDAFGFLFSQCLEALRFDIESGYRTASDIAENIRKRLITIGKTEDYDPGLLLFLVQCFGSAKLDLGEELSGAVAHLLDQTCNEIAEHAQTTEAADLFGLVGDLVKQAHGDPFAVYSLLAESSEGIPDEHRASMATALLLSGEEPAAEASIGWLLDPAESVRHALGKALEEAARMGKVTPIMLRRMITMRNWLPETSRSSLDVAIAIARRKCVSPAQWSESKIREIICTGIDGSGAFGVLTHCRNKRKGVLGSLVLKQGIGVRDAWAQQGVKTKEIEQAFFEASLMDQFFVSKDFIGNAISHSLAVGLQIDSMAPFGLLQFLEAAGISSVQPELISVQSLLEAIRDGHALNRGAVENLLMTGSEVADDCVFMDSWFEAGDNVDETLAGHGATRKKREALVVEKVLEPRREWWTQITAWTAYILFEARSDERWQEFYAAAWAMLEDRPLHEIPLMRRIAEQTVLVSENRKMAA